MVKKLKLIWLSLLIFLAPLIVRSEFPKWVNIGPPGGEIIQIEISPVNNKVIYVLTQSWSWSNDNSVFKSEDGGRFFRKVNLPIKDEAGNPLITFHISPSSKNEDVLYVATSDGIYIVEGSNCYNIGLKGKCVYAVAVNPQDDNVCFAGTSSEGIFKTEDRGKNWVLLDNGIDTKGVYCLSISKTGNKIYAGTKSNHIFLSENNGNSWSLFFNEICVPSSIKIDPVDENTIYVISGDVRKYLSKIANGVLEGLKPGPPFVFSVEVSPLDNKEIYAGTTNGVCVSKDGGKNWKCYNEQFSNNMVIISLAIDYLSEKTIFAGTFGGGLYVSVDDGENWTYRSDGILANEVISFKSNGSTLYAGTLEGGLFKSNDDGKTWEMKNPSSNGNFYVLGIYAIAFSDSDPSIIYLSTLYDGKALYKSVDGGENWTPLGDHGWGMIFLEVDPQDPNVIYSTLGKSSDGGWNWNYCYPLTDGQVYDVAIDKNNPRAIFLATYNSEIFKSIDGGLIWTESDEGIQKEQCGGFQAIAISPKNSQIIYAALNGVYKSIDGGNSWSLKGLENERIYAIAVDPDDPEVIYAGTKYNGIYRSVDGGNHWESFNNGLEATTVFDLNITSQSPKTIYAGASTGVYKLIFVSPPTVSSVSKLSDPFRLKVTGSNFHSDLKVYIGGELWTNIKYKNSSQIVLKGRNALKQKFPKGVAVEIKIVNGDGGEAVYSYTR